MVRDNHGRLNRRNLLKSTGVAAAVGLAGCGGDGGDGGDGGTPTPGDGGDTGGDTGGDGGTPTEQGPSDRSKPYLDTPLVPDYYPDSYWRVVDGAMDESGQTMYTAYFGAMIEKVLKGFYEYVDFFEWNITTLGTAEVYSRFTTEASRGQINPDVLFTYDPIAMRQLYTANLLEHRVSPNLSETDAFPDRTKTGVDGMVQQHHSWGTHVFNPTVYQEAGVSKPPKTFDIGWYTDHIEDNPDFYNENTAQYDGITSTSGWQQMDFYAVENGEDWMKQQYSEMATTNPRSFWSTSTMGGWVANGEVAMGMGLAQWIVLPFVAPDFDVNYDGGQLWWSDVVMHNIMHPNYQVVKDASNPNSAKLFADWMLSPDGQTHSSRAWYLGPGRSDIPNEDLRTDPVLEVSTNKQDIQENANIMGEAIFMNFNKRTVRSDKKAKYKDMWYNLMT